MEFQSVPLSRKEFNKLALTYTGGVFGLFSSAQLARRIFPIPHVRTTPPADNLPNQEVISEPEATHKTSPSLPKQDINNISINSNSESQKIEAIPSQLPNSQPNLKPISNQIGEASIYSVNGCLGCNSKKTMANGQPLRDNKLTVAYNNAPLGTKVRVINLDTGQSVVALVTDTGGFNTVITNSGMPRMIDLTPATARAINIRGLGRVKVEVVK